MEIQCLFRAVLCLFVCTVCKVSYRTLLFCLFLRCGVLSLCWYASCRSIWKKRLNSSYSSKAKQIAWPPKQKRRPLPLLLSPSFFYVCTTPPPPPPQQNCFQRSLNKAPQTSIAKMCVQSYRDPSRRLLAG